MTQEALKLAIQLRDTASGYWTENEIPIIEKLIELLAQEQEPVGRFAKFTDGIWRPVTDYSAGVPLYTHPPQRTEQEPVPPPWWPAVENILNEYGLQAIDFVADFKQALAQTQEPVALQYPQKDIDWQREQQIKAQASTPPQRTWVGLTDDDICMFSMWLDDKSDVAVFTAIEAKLKEKNT